MIIHRSDDLSHPIVALREADDLRLDAKWILTVLLTVDGCRADSVEDLCDLFGVSKDRALNRANRLEEAGFLARVQSRDDLGGFTYEWHLYENPADNPST